MRRSAYSIAAMSLVLLFSGFSPVFAQWANNGTVVCSQSGKQFEPQSVTDGSRGTIVTWLDYRTGLDIYAQRVDSLGNMLWTSGGVLISAAGGGGKPHITTDGSGGAIITWGSGDIFAQRIDSNGAVQWAPAGVNICTATGIQRDSQIASDGAGGAIITWRDGRGANEDIYVQRVDANGTVRWTSDGIPICVDINDQLAPVLVTDDDNGAIIAWHDGRSGTYHIYAQRVDSTGFKFWPYNGTPICMASGGQYFPAIARDNTGGATIVWQDYRNGSSADLYAQRIDASGNDHWTTNGVVVCDAANAQYEQDIMVFGTGGSLIAWADLRSGEYDIYAQRMIDNGNPRWFSNGMAICAASGHQRFPRIAFASVSGTFLYTWADERSGTYDIYAQRTDNLAVRYWAADGIPVCTASGIQLAPCILADERDGAIIAWHDARYDDGDIYAQRIEPGGFWGWIRPYIVDIVDVPDDQGGKLTVIWHVYDYEQHNEFNVTHYSIWRKFPYQGSVALLDHWINDEMLDKIIEHSDGSIRRYITTGAQTDVWEWITDVPAHQFDTYAYTVTSLYDSMGTDPHWQHFMVSMQTDDPDLYWDTAVDSGYSVDNLAPSVPSGFQVVYNAGSNLLMWDECPDEDFQYFSIYRGESEDFIPSSDNLIYTMIETSWVDGEGTWQHHYKISATDNAGNESGATGPDFISEADDVPMVPASFALYQNVPNPFNPVTTIEFDLPRRERVLLAVYDMSGRLVRVLVDGEREPGTKSVTWDGCNTTGRQVASGVYFYRLVAGDFAQTKKMLLLR